MTKKTSIKKQLEESEFQLPVNRTGAGVPQDTLRIDHSVRIASEQIRDDVRAARRFETV